MYVVKYCGGDHEDYYEKVIFVTDKKSTATKYVTKFNRILKKWKEYYRQYTENEYGFEWIKERYVDQYYRRWYSLRNITRCYWEEVEIR